MAIIWKSISQNMMFWLYQFVINYDSRNSELGVVFSHTMPKIDFYYSHRFSWEKNGL